MSSSFAPALDETYDQPLDSPIAADSLLAAHQRNARALFRYFLVRTGRDAHLSDELMQQLWLACRQSGDQVHREPARWLWTVARNLVAGHWRRTKSRPAQLPIADPRIAAQLAERLADGDLPEDLLQKKEIHDQLLLALTTLEGDVQDLIVDHYFHGLSHDTLAGRLGIGVRAVEGRLYRARQQLREQLARLDPEEI